MLGINFYLCLHPLTECSIFTNSFFMKKIFILLLVVCFATTLFSQTIVSTTPSNKNFILEEYTGTNCTYCPDGHKIANQIMTNNPGRAWAINIHQGGFSGNNPDYKTEFGNALANQYSINSYPNGTCNRGTGVVARNLWTSQCANIIAQPSPVNVAATVTIDWNTRLLTVYVEAYYTDNAANPTNKLNIALLQNNVLGPQVGGSSYYPAMMRFGKYQHMHMLRHLLTGQWGVEIPATTTGTFYSQTFTYNIPAHIRNVPICLEDLEVIAFVCENNKTILTGCKADLTIENGPACFGRIEMIEDKIVAVCDGSNSAICYIRNSNDFDVNSVEFAYSIGGGAPDYYVWSRKTIAPQSFDTIHLPTFLLAPNLSQDLMVTITKFNDINCNFSCSKAFKKEVVFGEEEMKLVITTDRYCSETTFKIFNPDGTILLQGGPWTDLTSNGTTVREFNFIPTMEGCHRLEVYDAFGDGINAGYGAGNVKILDSKGTQMYYNNGQFGSKLTATVYLGETADITATSGTNGTIVPINETTYPVGSRAKYSFLPDAHYEVDEVFIDGEPLGKTQPTSYTFSDVDRNYSISVTYRLMPSITASAGENGTISPIGETFHATGSTPEFVFIPDRNYEVEEVFVDGVPMGLEHATSYTFPAVDKDYTIHVVFKLLPGYNITASAGENGAISPAGNVFCATGLSAEFVFTPDANYEVEEVFVDGEPMGLPQATGYTIPAVDKDYTIHVTFRLMPSITATAGENGTISPIGKTFYATGSSATFAFTPDSDYEVEDLYIDGEPMGLEYATSYTFPAVDKDYTIHVTFKKIIGIKDINGVLIAVAPNPVNDKLWVTGTYDKLEIFSIAGQILATAFNQPVVDLNNLTKGIYFVKIQTNGQVCTFKIIK